MEKIYKHPCPGTILPLNIDGKPVVSSAGKTTAIFRDTGRGSGRCGICRTTDEKVQEAIEFSNAYKKGVITKIASPEEMRAFALAEERQKNRARMIKLANDGVLNVDKFREMKASELYAYAQDLGINTTTGKGNRLKEEVLTDVLDLLFPTVLETEAEVVKEEKPKPKPRAKKHSVKEDKE